MILDAPRLSLLALNTELAGLQASSRTAFFNALAVTHNAVWPPEPFGDAALAWSKDNLARDPDGVGWYGWTMLTNDDERLPPKLIGAAALVGRPDEDGDVELAFGLLPEYRGRGYGAEAVRALATWALANGARRVIVHLDAEDYFAARTLEKTGFSDTREPPYPGVARWARAA
ncbi:MAG: GNAT family N-acetyltransferase [Alphaproteobacteria bacterium]